MASDALPTPNAQQHFGPASRRQRFVNLLIDVLVGQMIFGGVLGLIVGIVSEVGGAPEVADSFLAIGEEIPFVYVIVYYALCESITGRTLGKFVTGTRVVTLDGGRPSVGTFLARSAVRVIPFEAFSFLGDSPGWHDAWSKTMVVRTRPPRAAAANDPSDAAPPT